MSKKRQRAKSLEIKDGPKSESSFKIKFKRKLEIFGLPKTANDVVPLGPNRPEPKPVEESAELPSVGAPKKQPEHETEVLSKRSNPGSVVEPDLPLRPEKKVKSRRYKELERAAKEALSDPTLYNEGAYDHKLAVNKKLSSRNKKPLLDHSDALIRRERARSRMRTGITRISFFVILIVIYSFFRFLK